MTRLLDSFLDNTEVNKIRKTREDVEQFSIKQAKKLESSANAEFTKAITDNFNTIWRDPERVKEELANANRRSVEIEIEKAPESEKNHVGFITELHDLDNEESMHESNFSGNSDDMVSSESRDRHSHSYRHENEIIVDIEGLDGRMSDEGN